MQHDTFGHEIGLAEQWLEKSALPLWQSQGIDWEKGGFFDALDLVTGVNSANRKRLRVITRQIYVFSQAAKHNIPQAREAVLHGIDFIFSRARHPLGAFLSNFDLDGNAVGDQRDTYDLAFVLFALAQAYSITQDPKLAQEALSLAAFFSKVLSHPRGGFVEGIPAEKPRRQNPHMHLLEASLAWVGCGEKTVFPALAHNLVDLFKNHFFDPETGAILEYFDDSLGRSGPDIREAVEPGHLFEWVWLLDQYESLTGQTVPYLDQIYDFAHRHGVDRKSGFLFGEIGLDGSLHDAKVRLWPHAEWLRAEAAWKRRHPEADPDRVRQAFTALWRFLETERSGLWFEHYDPENGGFQKGPVPASSLYHIVGGFKGLKIWE